jgi:hypothetical protein
VLLQGYETGRCEYTEVINLSALWNLIRLNDNNSFQLYPPRVTAPDIIDHLEYMAAQPEKYEGYKMVITDALLPFCLSTYTIESSTLPEHYTLFLGQLGQKTVYDEGSFIIEGQKIYQGFVEKILQLVYCNPTTITDQAQVKDVLLNIAAQLREKGPLAPNDFAPSLINPD